MLRLTEGRLLFEHGRQHGLLRRHAQTQIDEAGARHLGCLDQARGAGMSEHRVGKLLSQLARVGAQRFGQLHGEIAGDIAMGRDLRALERNHRGERGRVGQGTQQAGDGVGEDGFDNLFLSRQHAKRSGRWVEAAAQRARAATSDRGKSETSGIRPG